MKTKLAIISFLMLLTLISCGNDSGVTTTETGLQFQDQIVGDGRNAQNGDLVSVQFIGWIVQDSSNLFSDWSADSTRTPYLIGNSYIRNQPIKFILGENAFIKGTDEGIVGMKVGGKRSMIIPSKLAYGEQGAGPVPPNADLKIDIELLDVKDRIMVEMWDLGDVKPITTESGLKYIIVKEGEGKNAEAGNVVTVHYSGFLEDGTKFDSSVEKDEPITFVLGNKQVIPGWDEGITYMKKGSKVRLIVPPSLGYGDMAVGKIPAKSTLIFDVELIDIK